MFYCTIYQNISKQDPKGRIRLCLSFYEEQEAIKATKEAIKIARNLGASIFQNRHDGHFIIRGNIDCLGPESNEIFTAGEREKYYFIHTETDSTLASRRWPYHPIKDIIVDGTIFLQKDKETTTESPANWYDELSELNN